MEAALSSQELNKTAPAKPYKVRMSLVSEPFLVLTLGLLGGFSIGGPMFKFCVHAKLQGSLKA